ncbi:hypothetical protein Dimus_016177 [Dionaea muscipula]
METNYLLLGLDPAIIELGANTTTPRVRVRLFCHSNPKLGKHLLSGVFNAREERKMKGKERRAKKEGEDEGWREFCREKREFCRENFEPVGCKSQRKGEDDGTHLHCCTLIFF